MAYAPGSGGYIGVATESIPGGTGTPGTWVAPDEFVLADSSTLKSTPDKKKHAVLGNSPDAYRVYRNGKYKNGGGLNLALFPNMAMRMLVAAMGDDTYLPAVSGATIASATTANGTTTLTLTGGGAYQPGAFVKIGTDPSAIRRQVYPGATYGTVSSPIKVAAIDTDVSSLALVQPAQHMITRYSRASGHLNLLRTLSIEENVGGEYSERYPGCLVDKWTVKGGKDKTEVTVDIKGGKARTRATATAFDEAQASLDDLPFEFTDGFLVFEADPDGTGTSTLRQVIDAEEWSVSIENKLIEKATLDGGTAYRYFPGGERMLACDFKILNSAGRPALWEDFVTQDVDTKFMAQLVNGGNCFGVFLPNLRYMESDEIKSINEVIGEQVKAEARRAGGYETGYFFVINEETSAY